MKAKHQFRNEQDYLEYLRDKRATKAMVAELGAQTPGNGGKYLWSSPDQLAERAYEIADAMERARLKRK